MSKKQSSLPAPSNNNPHDWVISPDDLMQKEASTEPPPKKRGRVKGSKSELDALRSGGFGDQSSVSVFLKGQGDGWKLEGKKVLCE